MTVTLNRVRSAKPHCRFSRSRQDFRKTLFRFSARSSVASKDEVSICVRVRFNAASVVERVDGSTAVSRISFAIIGRLTCDHVDTRKHERVHDPTIIRRYLPEPI